MTSPAETERKFAQLYNEVHAIYEMVTPIGETQRIHGQRLAALERDLRALRDEHGAKLDQHSEKLDQHGEKLDQQGEKLDQILELLRSGRAGTP